jgi:nucleotide-binding universal stress UspA family protein
VLHVIAALDPHAGAVGALGASHESAERIQQIIVECVTKALSGRPTAADIKFFVHVRIGKPATEILGLAAEVSADLLFVGSHGKVGLERFVLGSVSERVVREARCPVMVARPKSYAEVERIEVVRYDHERSKHRPPHCYTYTTNQVITRPDDWPIG